MTDFKKKLEERRGLDSKNAQASSGENRGAKDTTADKASFDKASQLINLDGKVPSGTKVLTIDVEQIKLSPYQPRIISSEVQQSIVDLADSILQNGLINPIVVRPTGSFYELVGGERRFRAIRDILKHKTINCIVSNKMKNNDQAALVALIDNHIRENLSDYETILAIKKFCMDFGYPFDQEFITQKFKISRSKYYRLISMLDLPGFIIDVMTNRPSLITAATSQKLKTELNRLYDLYDKNHVDSQLSDVWEYFISLDEEKIRDVNLISLLLERFVGESNPKKKISNQNDSNLTDQGNSSKEILNKDGVKVGSFKISAAAKGGNVLSMRLNVVDDISSDKIDRILEILNS